jgi:hypothetical protein
MNIYIDIKPKPKMPKIIIVSLEHHDNYVSFENGYETKKYSKMCLGHEIHMTRYVLIDMIIIFNHNLSYLKPILEKEFTNLIFIENLQLYASYLNQKKCKLFISEWSGGGQLSHYCYEGKILYYLHTYRDYHYIGQEKERCKQSMETDMIPCWDFKHSRDIDINLFDSITNLINNLEEYISSNLKQT